MLSTTSYPAATASLATVPPMCPLPIIPMVVIAHCLPPSPGMIAGTTVVNGRPAPTVPGPAGAASRRDEWTGRGPAS
ncbi:hypothetical protein GCM10028775_69620 [Catellatospora paridis]